MATPLAVLAFVIMAGALIAVRRPAWFWSARSSPELRRLTAIWSALVVAGAAIWLVVNLSVR